MVDLMVAYKSLKQCLHSITYQIRTKVIQIRSYHQRAGRHDPHNITAWAESVRQSSVPTKEMTQTLLLGPPRNGKSVCGTSSKRDKQVLWGNWIANRPTLPPSINPISLPNRWLHKLCSWAELPCNYVKHLSLRKQTMLY